MTVLKHRHHIIPKYLGGTDDPLNVIELTVEQHFHWHRIMWLLYGRWQDRLAWRSLSKQIGIQEITKIKCSEAGKQRKGKVPWNKGGKGLQIAWNLGRSASDQEAKRLRTCRIGVKPWNKGKTFDYSPRPDQYPMLTCPKCGKEGKRGPGMYRFHFDGCRIHEPIVG